MRRSDRRFRPRGTGCRQITNPLPKPRFTRLVRYDWSQIHPVKWSADGYLMVPSTSGLSFELKMSTCRREQI